MPQVATFMVKKMNSGENPSISREAISDAIYMPVNVKYDDASTRGRFGWTEVGSKFIPYIFRYGQKYCSTEIAQVILNSYLSRLHKSLSSCAMITSYSISEAECKLLNEINFVHCEDKAYTNVPFTCERTTVVKLSDVVEFYKFLCDTYYRLRSVSSDPHHRNGFLEIGHQSVVPYVIAGNQMYLPFDYFQGHSIEVLEGLTVNLSGWHLPYLRLCCKIQKTRDSLFASQTIKVNRYEDVVKLFPKGTRFQRHWPEIEFYSHLLVEDDPHLCWTQWTNPPIAPVSLPVLRPLANFTNKLLLGPPTEAGGSPRQYLVTKGHQPTVTTLR